MLRGFWLGVALLVAGCGGAEGDQAGDPARLTPEQTGEAGASSEPEPVTPVCEAGRQIECPCSSGEKGAQACADDGSKWGDCTCGNAVKAPTDLSKYCAAPQNQADYDEADRCPPLAPLAFVDCNISSVQLGLCFHHTLLFCCLEP